MKEIKFIVASNLVALRKSKSMTQTDVAKTLNYSDKSVSKWENGESMPDISVLTALADMYGVTLDYLTHEDAEEQLKYVKTQKNSDDQNRIIILLMAVAVIFLICTLVFIYMYLNERVYWQAFVWGVPATCVILMFFHRKWGGWGEKKTYKIVVSSVFWWSLLASAYLQFLQYRLWLIFIVGVPIQVIIILGSKLQSAEKFNIFKKR